MKTNSGPPTVLAGVAGGTGTTGGTGWVCTRNGAGNYTLVFTGARRAIVTCTAGALIQLTYLTTPTGASINVISNNSAGTGTDGVFNFIAAVW